MGADIVCGVNISMAKYNLIRHALFHQFDEQAGRQWKPRTITLESCGAHIPLPSLPSTSSVTRLMDKTSSTLGIGPISGGTGVDIELAAQAFQSPLEFIDPSGQRVLQILADGHLAWDDTSLVNVCMRTVSGHSTNSFHNLTNIMILPGSDDYATLAEPFALINKHVKSGMLNDLPYKFICGGDGAFNSTGIGLGSSFSLAACVCPYCTIPSTHLHDVTVGAYTQRTLKMGEPFPTNQPHDRTLTASYCQVKSISTCQSLMRSPAYSHHSRVQGAK